MTDILTNVLGLVVVKARSATASYFSNGDLTDEELRKIFISNIDDIKSSLRGLSRQPLNASLCFFKENISRMGMAVRNTSAASRNEQEAIADAAKTFVAVAGASTSQQTKQRSLRDVLSSLAFKIDSQERWADAKKSFKKSRDQATIAFGNTTLSIEDIIMACKLRIVSSILEKFLRDPEAAVQDCLLYLQELHDMPSVSEMFTVHIIGGVKSHFNKKKRSEIIESVVAMNNFILEFMQAFLPEFTLNMALSRQWPVIQLTDKEKLREHIIVDDQLEKIRSEAQNQEEKTRSEARKMEEKIKSKARKKEKGGGSLKKVKKKIVSHSKHCVAGIKKTMSKDPSQN